MNATISAYEAENGQLQTSLRIMKSKVVKMGGPKDDQNQGFEATSMIDISTLLLTALFYTKIQHKLKRSA